MAESKPWYREGLRFGCTECGRCCTMPGYVWVNRSEVRRLADHLELEIGELRRRYVRLVDGRPALIDRADGACVFWDEGCTVYAARPGQCRTFPFWKENVATAEAWEQTAEECEGIGEGPRYEAAIVGELLRGARDTFAAEPKSKRAD